MTTQDLIDSAKFCGYEPYDLDIEEEKGRIYIGSAVIWNPRENAEQRDMILKALLAKGYDILYEENNMLHEISHVTQKGKTFECATDDFLTLAGAYVFNREKQE